MLLHTLFMLCWTILEVVHSSSGSDVGAESRNFTCVGKVIGGYYADVNDKCQTFHVCTLGENSAINDIVIRCLEGTVFDQKLRVCERTEEVNCAVTEDYYHLNNDLYGPGIIPHSALNQNQNDNDPSMSRFTYRRPVRPINTKIPLNSRATSALETEFADPDSTKGTVDPKLLYENSNQLTDEIDLAIDNFCNDKKPGNMYADIQADCSMFHHCYLQSKSIKKATFMCGTGLKFHQKLQKCMPSTHVNCIEQIRKYSELGDLCADKTMGAGQTDSRIKCQFYTRTKFHHDGTVLHRLPCLCKTGFRFDEKEQICLPQEEVDCDNVFKNIQHGREKRRADGLINNIMASKFADNSRVQRALDNLAELNIWAQQNADDSLFVEMYEIHDAPQIIKKYPKKSTINNEMASLDIASQDQNRLTRRKRSSNGTNENVSSPTKEEIMLDELDIIINKTSDEKNQEISEQLDFELENSKTEINPHSLAESISQPSNINNSHRKNEEMIISKNSFQGLPSDNSNTKNDFVVPISIDKLTKVSDIGNRNQEIPQTIQGFSKVRNQNSENIESINSNSPRNNFSTIQEDAHISEPVNTIIGSTLPTSTTPIPAINVTKLQTTPKITINSLSETTHNTINEEIDKKSTIQFPDIAISSTTQKPIPITNPSTTQVVTESKTHSSTDSSISTSLITEIKSTLPTTTAISSSAITLNTSKPEMNENTSFVQVNASTTSPISSNISDITSPLLYTANSSFVTSPTNATSTAISNATIISTVPTFTMNTTTSATTTNTTTTMTDLTKSEPKNITSIEAPTNVSIESTNITTSLPTIEHVTSTETPHPIVTPSPEVAVLETSFTCKNKKLEQFYPDPETNCQSFHYCSPGFNDNQVLDLKFLCKGSTKYDVKSQKCIDMNLVTCDDQLIQDKNVTVSDSTTVTTTTTTEATPKIIITEAPPNLLLPLVNITIEKVPIIITTPIVTLKMEVVVTPLPVNDTINVTQSSTTPIPEIIVTNNTTELILNTTTKIPILVNTTINSSITERPVLRASSTSSIEIKDIENTSEVNQEHTTEEPITDAVPTELIEDESSVTDTLSTNEVLEDNDPTTTAGWAIVTQIVTESSFKSKINPNNMIDNPTTTSLKTETEKSIDVIDTVTKVSHTSSHTLSSSSSSQSSS